MGLPEPISFFDDPYFILFRCSLESTRRREIGISRCCCRGTVLHWWQHDLACARRRSTATSSNLYCFRYRDVAIGRKPDD